MTIRHLAIRLHAEVTAEAARDPRRVTRVARHVVLAMRELFVPDTRVAPRRVVFLHRLRVRTLLAVIRIARRDRIGRLLYPPPDTGLDDRVLNYIASLQLDIPSARIFSLRVACQNFQYGKPPSVG